MEFERTLPRSHYEDLGLTLKVVERFLCKLNCQFILQRKLFTTLRWRAPTWHTKATYFVTSVGNNKRVISLGPIVNALGDAQDEALPGFHAFSGADVTGRYAGKGKLTCWQALSRCSMEVVSAFAALGTSEKLEVDTERAIETFVCQLYEPGSNGGCW